MSYTVFWAIQEVILAFLECDLFQWGPHPCQPPKATSREERGLREEWREQLVAFWPRVPASSGSTWWQGWGRRCHWGTREDTDQWGPLWNGRNCLGVPLEGRGGGLLGTVRLLQCPQASAVAQCPQHAPCSMWVVAQLRCRHHRQPDLTCKKAFRAAGRTQASLLNHEGQSGADDFTGTSHWALWAPVPVAPQGPSGDSPDGCCWPRHPRGTWRISRKMLQSAGPGRGGSLPRGGLYRLLTTARTNMIYWTWTKIHQSSDSATDGLNSTQSVHSHWWTLLCL